MHVMHVDCYQGKKPSDPTRCDAANQCDALKMEKQLSTTSARYYLLHNATVVLQSATVLLLGILLLSNR